MKVTAHCKDCLKNLTRQTVTLSRGSGALLASSLQLVDRLFDPTLSPTDISNPMLAYVRHQTGAGDPFAQQKAAEFRAALHAAQRLRGFFPDTLEGALQSSAFGNGGDFFVEHQYDTDRFAFDGNVAKIARAVYTSNKILILGDNPGDFVFDQPLVSRLKSMSKQVFYAIKERPVQNDMSVTDLPLWGAVGVCGDVVSTGTDEVGMRREAMSGVVKECWEDDSLVLAKGMGNYETMSEFDRERPVFYIMKVKCSSVAEALGRKIGEYIAIAGEEHG